MFLLIKLYTPATRAKIKEVLEDYLLRVNAPMWIENLMGIVDELIKNGLKANYKHCIVRERVANAVRNLHPEREISEVLRDRRLYNDFAHAFGDVSDASDFVRKALSQEARLIDIKMQMRQQNRRMNADEFRILRHARELIHLRRQAKIFDMRVFFRIEMMKNSIEIDICNNAPILTDDLNRINEKRREFGMYADAGEEGLFFANHLDSSGAGAGLGYALIDARLREMKLDPQASMNIISTENTTVALSIDSKTLRKPLRCVAAVVA